MLRLTRHQALEISDQCPHMIQISFVWRSKPLNRLESSSQSVPRCEPYLADVVGWLLRRVCHAFTWCCWTALRWQVEAKYGGEAWYPARIIGLRREQVVDVKVGSRWIKQKKEVVSPSAKVTSYDVVYTDGSLEERVSVDEVRPIIDRKDFIAHQVCSRRVTVDDIMQQLNA